MRERRTGRRGGGAGGEGLCGLELPHLVAAPGTCSRQHPRYGKIFETALPLLPLAGPISLTR